LLLLRFRAQKLQFNLFTLGRSGGVVEWPTAYNITDYDYSVTSSSCTLCQYNNYSLCTKCQNNFVSYSSLICSAYHSSIPPVLQDSLHCYACVAYLYLLRIAILLLYVLIEMIVRCYRSIQPTQSRVHIHVGKVILTA